MLFVIILVFFIKYPTIVISLLFFLSIGMICYLGHVDPHDHPVTRKMELFNEVMLILILYHLLLSLISIPIDRDLIENGVVETERTVRFSSRLGRSLMGHIIFL